MIYKTLATTAKYSTAPNIMTARNSNVREADTT